MCGSYDIVIAIVLLLNECIKLFKKSFEPRRVTNDYNEWHDLLLLIVFSCLFGWKKKKKKKKKNEGS